MTSTNQARPKTWRFFPGSTG